MTWWRISAIIDRSCDRSEFVRVFIFNTAETQVKNDPYDKFPLTLTIFDLFRSFSNLNILVKRKFLRDFKNKSFEFRQGTAILWRLKTLKSDQKMKELTSTETELKDK